MWNCNKCGTENEENMEICQGCACAREEAAENGGGLEQVRKATEREEVLKAEENPEIEQIIETAEDIETAETDSAEEEAGAKSNRKRNIIIGIAAAIVAIAVIVVIFSSLSKPDNSKAVSYEQMMDGNPEITEEGVAFEVNGVQVDEIAWNYYFMSAAVNYAGSLGAAVEDVDWNKVTDGETALEIVKYDAMKAIISNAAAVTFAKEWGIALTKDEMNIIDVDLDYWKQVHGKDVFKKLNVKDEANYREIYANVLLERKVIESVSENPEKYLKGVDLKKYANDQSATVKIIAVNKGEDETLTAKAKTKIDALKARLDSGESFDTIWIENYEEINGIKLEQAMVNTIYKDGINDKKIESAALALSVGETSAVIDTDYAYVIMTRISGYTEVENYIMDESNIYINKDMIDDSGVK